MSRLKCFLDQNIGGRKACQKRKEIRMRKLSFWVKGLFVVTLIVPQISLAQTQSAGEQQIPQLLFVQMLNQGLITQSQYQEESQKILNQLAE
jgi:uncharacterized membrane protein YvbJ